MYYIGMLIKRIIITHINNFQYQDAASREVRKMI